ncbi:MAG TPA: efflux RND transporter periplasmic adaptor subunit [Chloroflexota bacterium]|nr:efflux RND transporter periplasmic adaptor subunit [Chloroflexota bacterium]
MSWSDVRQSLDWSRVRGSVATLSPRRKRLLAGGVAVLLVAGAGAYYLTSDDSEDASGACQGGEVLYWYDPMVPDKQFEEPGKSPFMDMQLVAKCASETAGGIKVSPAMLQNLGVRTTEARMMDIAPTIRAVGRVGIDERLIAEVQTLTPGFVEQLSIRAEGETVQRGQRIASVYSPELFTAQNEYKAVLSMPSSVAPASLRSAARQRLQLLGLPASMIQRLERGGAPQRTYPVFSPASGVVTEIGTRPGAQVSPGQSIVTLAGLSRVLVIAEVPEITLGDVKVGLPVEVTFPAYSGEVWKGTIDYIYPTLDPESRTARARITLANPRLRLKEGMLANVLIMGTGGMALVVPSEAVIETGRRKIVVVRRNGAFIPVEVRTGREAGEQTQIIAGLQPGAQVVVSGQFLIDSEASLSGVIERLNANAPKEGAGPQLPVARGTIRSMDLEQGRVTIEHGPVPMMNWPPMTMTFAVPNTSMLRGLTKGARVEFAFQPKQQGDTYVIQSIRRDPDQ